MSPIKLIGQDCQCNMLLWKLAMEGSILTSEDSFDLMGLKKKSFTSTKRKYNRTISTLRNLFILLQIVILSGPLKYHVETFN